MKMEQCGVSIQDFVIEKNQMWFCSSFLNGLFRKDLNSDEVFVEYYFSEYPVIGRTLFSKILMMDRKIILIPTVAEKIYIYDIEEKKMISYPLPECINRAKNKQGFLFGDAFIYKKNIIMLPDYAEQIVILNIETEKIESSNLLQNVIEKKINRRPLHYIEHESILVKDKIYNFFLNYLLEYNFETQKLSMYRITDERYSIKSICAYKDEICVIDSNHSVYFWKGDTCTKKIEVLYEANRILQNDSFIYMIDMPAGTITEVEVKSENITFQKYQLKHANISNIKVIAGEIYLSSITNNTITIFNLGNKKNRKRKVLINTNRISNIFEENEFNVTDSIIFEQGSIELQILLSNHMRYVNYTSKEGKIGKTIYLKGK